MLKGISDRRIRAKISDVIDRLSSDPDAVKEKLEVEVVSL